MKRLIPFVAVLALALPALCGWVCGGVPDATPVSGWSCDGSFSGPGFTGWTADGVRVVNAAAVSPPAFEIPAVWYKCDDCAGSAAVADSGLSPQPAVAPDNTSAISVPGHVGGALIMRGAGYVVCGGNFVSLLNGSDFTLSFLVSVCDDGSNPELFNFFSLSAGYVFCCYYNSGAGSFGMYDRGAAWASATCAFTPGDWWHFVFVKAGSSCTFYLNGAVLATDTVIDPVAVGQCYIGGAGDDGASRRLDDVRLYGRAFSPAGVGALFAGYGLPQYSPPAAPVAFYSSDQWLYGNEVYANGGAVPLVFDGCTVSCADLPSVTSLSVSGGYGGSLDLSLMGSLSELAIAGTCFGTDAIDSMLFQLDANGLWHGSFDFTGTAGCSEGGAAALSDLIGKGWSVSGP